MAETFTAETPGARKRILADRAARQRARDRDYRARKRAARTPAEVEQDRARTRERVRALRRRPKVSARQLRGLAQQARGMARDAAETLDALERIWPVYDREAWWSEYHEFRPEVRAILDGHCARCGRPAPRPEPIADGPGTIRRRPWHCKHCGAPWRPVGGLRPTRIRLRLAYKRCGRDDPEGRRDVVAVKRVPNTPSGRVWLKQYAKVVNDELGEQITRAERLLHRKSRKYRRAEEAEGNERALAALRTWADEHGRWPRKAELTDPSLPGWGTVHRRWGGLVGAQGAAEREREWEQREQSDAARDDKFKTLEDVRYAVGDWADWNDDYPERRHFEDNDPAEDVWLPTWQRFAKLVGSEGRAEALLYDWWEELSASGAFPEREAPDDPSRGQPA